MQRSLSVTGTAMACTIMQGMRCGAVFWAPKLDKPCVGAGACGQLVVEQTQGGCGGGALSQKQADIEELGKGMRRLTTAVA